MKKESIIVLVVLFVIFGLLILINNNKSSSLNYDFKIYFFNAGKADAILISKNDKYMMIDTGEQSLSDDILRYFQNNNITKLEYLIITHFDKDHVGSASSIIDNIDIGEVIQSNVPKESEYYTNYLISLSKKGVTPTVVSFDYDISLGDVGITVNGPDKIYDKNESNNSSLIVSMTNGENKFLFMGDSENKRIRDFVSNNSKTYDFIKVPYHGNYLKRLSSLFESTKVKYGVMTCSNSEGCDSETIGILNKYNIKYYMTKNGSISVLSDGKKIIING